MKQRLALIAVLCLLVGILSGCGKSKIENYSAEEITTATEAAEEMAEAAQPDNSYTDETVVCTVDGTDITWDEYYYWLNNCRLSVESSLGEITDWSAANAYYTSNTNEEVVRMLAQDDMLYYHVVLAAAEAAGVAPTDEEVEAELLLEADAYFGDGNGEVSDEEKAAFEDYLAESDVSYALQVLIAKEQMAEQALYAYDTADITDEEVLAWAEEQGYMYAKHILLLSVDAETREALDEATIAEKAETAAYLSAELNEAKAAELAALEAAGETAAAAPAETASESETASVETPSAGQEARDTFEAYFDSLMNEYTEDTGITTHPDGYIFLPGEMVEEFENAVLALDSDYGLSQVVESDYGYHIILRLPLECDCVLGQNSYGYDVTLRTYALNNMFSSMNSEAMANAKITWIGNFESINLAQLFATAE